MGSLSPAAVIVDSSGNPVTVISDGDDKRFLVEADIKPGASINIGAITSDPTQIFTQFLLDGGDPQSEYMNVDGSVTPVVFTVDAHADHDIILTEIRIICTARFDFATASFGEGDPLSVGLKLEVKVNSGSEAVLINVKRNEDFFRFPSSPFYEPGSDPEIITVSFVFGGLTKLVANTTDQVKVTVQDNLTPGGNRKIKYLTGTVYGTVEE